MIAVIDRFAVDSFVDRAPDGTQFTFAIAQSLSANANANGSAVVEEASAGALAALFMRLVGDSKSGTCGHMERAIDSTTKTERMRY